MAVLVLLVAAAAAAVLFFMRDQSPSPALDEAKAAWTPDYETLPPVADAETSRAYLMTNGAQLLRMHTIAVGQVEAGGRDLQTCTRDETELTANLPMDVAVNLITDVPDEALRGLLDGERAALAASLAACPESGTPSADGGTVAEELGRVVALVDLRLDTIGVQR